MRKFLFNVSLFCSVLIILGGAIEGLLFFRPNYYSYKLAQLEKHLNDIDILLIGNSHIEEGLRPDVIGPHCYNFAMAGRKLEYDVELAKRYVPKMRNLKYIVLPLDYEYFILGRYKANPNDKKNRSGEGSFVRTSKCMYYKYMGLRVDEFWYWSEFLNSDDKFLDRFWTSEDEIINCDSLGYVKIALERRQKEWAYMALSPYVDDTAPRDEVAYKRLSNQYEILAQLTKEHHVKLLFVDVPMYKTYQSFVNKKVFEERNAFVSELKSKYDNVYYYEYMNASGFVADDFADASHLSEFGAVKFSKMIKQAIENLQNNG